MHGSKVFCEHTHSSGRTAVLHFDNRKCLWSERSALSSERDRRLPRGTWQQALRVLLQ